jgi:hypothetical protein
MLTPRGPDPAWLRDYFGEIGFTPGGVRDRLQTDLLAGRHREHLPILLYRTREPDALSLLIRWFIVGEPIDRRQTSNSIRSDVVQIFLDCGLVVETDQTLRAAVMLAPFEQFWVATDTYSRLSTGTGPDDVLMVNATTLFLLNLAIRTPCRSLLDLGSGCGIVSMAAAQFAERVSAADLNPRAASFAAFNFWLNGVRNVETLVGDLFEPAAGRRFERILSNPPFYITPSAHRIFAENPMELDDFCRNLIRQVPGHLEEGGFLQMLMEWAEIEGEPWQERLTGWFQGTGCDAIVFHGGSFDPVRYAEIRIPVLTAPGDTQADVARFQEWVGYFLSRKVKRIHEGFVVMRRRSGGNWTQFERVASEPTLPAGDVIFERFRLRDHPLSDIELLSRRIRLAKGVQMRQVLEFTGEGWKSAASVPLTQTTGLQLTSELAPDVAQFVAGLDGNTKLSDRVALLAEQAPVPPAEVQRQCLALVRRLLRQGFLVTDAPA